MLYKALEYMVSVAAKPFSHELGVFESVDFVPSLVPSASFHKLAAFHTLGEEYAEL